MKPGRQNIILEVISQNDIETQQQLKEALAARGVKSTQATLSRDIKDLRLVKELGPNGNYRYTSAAKPEQEDSAQKLSKILKESVIACDTAQNLLVIKTLPGLAAAAGSAFDGMNVPNLVGTLAGDDTVFIAMKTSADAERFCAELKSVF